MEKIAFLFDVHYINYTNRLKNTFLKKYFELNLFEYGFVCIITTNRPQDFNEYKKEDGIYVYDIDEIRSEESKKYEILPEDPKGIYPAKFPWNLERYCIKKAVELNYRVVINLDVDVVLLEWVDGKKLREIIDSKYEKNVIKTNMSIFFYKKNSQFEAFHLHDKYIEHFNLKFEDLQYSVMDGPVILYMGESPNDLLRFFEKMEELTIFGYKKEYGFGYGTTVCGNWSIAIPLSGFKLKSTELPFHPHHKIEDRP